MEKVNLNSDQTEKLNQMLGIVKQFRPDLVETCNRVIEEGKKGNTDYIKKAAEMLVRDGVLPKELAANLPMFQNGFNV